MVKNVSEWLLLYNARFIARFTQGLLQLIYALFSYLFHPTENNLI